MENIGYNPETGPTDTEKKEFGRQEVERLLDEMNEVLGFDLGIERKEESQSIESKYGIKGNKTAEYDSSTEKIIIYKDFANLSKEQRAHTIYHLLGEVAIKKGIINREECQKILQEYNLPVDLEPRWIKELQKPAEVSEEDWQKYVLDQKIAERFACYIETGGKFAMDKTRLAYVSRAAQAKLLTDKRLSENFIKETNAFADYFTKALNESRQRGETEAKKEEEQLTKEQKPKGEKTAESEQMVKKEGFIEKILDELSATWKILTSGKEEKPQPSALRASPIGKLLMLILDYFETRQALQKKILDTCRDWALQRNMREKINKKIDADQKLNPFEARLRVRFHKRAAEGAEGWRGQLSEPIIEFLGGTIKDRQETAWKFWNMELSEADVGDIAGGFFALRYQAARLPDISLPAKLTFWMMNDYLKERLKGAEVAEKYKELTPRLDTGLVGSHTFYKENLGFTAREIRYLEENKTMAERLIKEYIGDREGDEEERARVARFEEHLRQYKREGGREREVRTEREEEEEEENEY